MPTYNRKHCIKNAIDSLLEQTYQNFELIIIDDGSTDGTNKYVKDLYLEEIKKGKIRYIKLSKNMGTSFARNKGLKIAKGDWIAYLDTDNEMLPGFLETFAESIIKNPEYKVFYAQIKKTNSGDVTGHEFNFNELIKGNFIDIGIFVHPIELFKELGGFDVKIKKIEDWDLIIRYTEKYKPIFINKILLNYYDGDDFTRSTNIESNDDNFKKMILNYFEIMPDDAFVKRYYDNYKKDEEIQWKNQELEVKNREIETKNEEIIEKIRDIENKNQRIKSTDKELSNINQLVREKDQEIQNKSQIIQAKDTEIQSKTQEIEWMKSSKFWKLKTFYEKFKFPVFRIGRLVKKAVFVLKRDGLFIFVKKCSYNFNVINHKVEKYHGGRVYSMKKMPSVGVVSSRKIIYVGHDANLAGAQLLTLSILKELKENFKFTISLILKSGGELEKEYKKYATIYNLTESYQTNDQKINLIKWLKSRGIGYAITNTVVSGDIAGLLHDEGVKVLSLVHEMSGSIKKYQWVDSAKTIAQKSDYVVFSSNMVKDEFNKIALVSGEKVRVRPQGLYQINAYEGDIKEARILLRKKLGLEEDSVIVIGVAAFSDYRKGTDLFLDVALRIKDKKIHFIWVGNIVFEMQEIVNQKIKNCKNITFIKTTSEISVYYAGADIYLMTSREDPFPSTVIESMSVGVPVIGFQDAGGFVDIVTEKTGILVPYLDTTAMARALELLIKDADKRKKLGEASKKLIADRFIFKDYVYYLLDTLGIDYKKVNTIIPKKRILFFSTNDYWGGSEIACVKLAQSFAIEGWITALVMKKHVPRPSILEKIVLETDIEFFERDIRDYCQSTELVSFIKEFNPDMVFISQGHLFESVELMKWCKKNKFKYVNFIPLVAECQLSLANRKIIAQNCVLLQESRQIFLDNQNAKDVMQKIFGISFDNFQVIRNGFDVPYNQKFVWTEPIDGVFKLAFLGRLEFSHKGIDMLLDVLTMKKWKKRSLIIKAYGHGPHEQLIIEKIKINNIKNFILCGFTDDLTNAILKVQGVIFPSRMEGTPIALVDSLLCNRMAIVTPVGGMSEVVTDGQNGFIAKSATVEGIDECLERAWQRRNEWRKLGENAGIMIRKIVPEFPQKQCIDTVNKILT